MTSFSEDGFDASATSDVDEGYTGASDDFFGSLGDAFMDSVDSIELGEDGSLDMRIRQPKPDPAAPESADSPSSAEKSGESEGGHPSADAKFLESQYKEVQGWATRVSQENADLRAQIAALTARMDQASTSTAEDDGSESDLDPSLQAQLDVYMSKNLDSVLSQRLGIPVEEVGVLLKEAAINRELRAAYAKYPDFEQHMPVMQEISVKYPDLTFDQLYSLAKTFYRPEASEQEGQAESVDAPRNPVPQGRTESTAPQPPQPQASREDLAERARKVATLQSASNDEGFTPARSIKTPRDAALAALEDMGL